jgi:hypothetical protein
MTEPVTLPEAIEQLIIGLWSSADCYTGQRAMARKVASAAFAEGAAHERARLEKLLVCRNGHPHYCPNCDKSISLPATRTPPPPEAQK